MLSRQSETIAASPYARRTIRPAAIAAALSISFALVSAQRAAVPPPVALRDVTVIDTTGDPPRSHMTVLITGSRITGIGPARTLALPAATRVVDGRGKYLIPGLWDMHVHLTHNRDGMIPLFIANGVTGIRDMGGNLELIDGIRAKIAEGVLVGPRLIRAGPFVEGPGHEWHPVSSRMSVTTEAEARQAVATLKARGVDFIKVHVGLSVEMLRVVADEAKKQGLPMVGHATVTPAQASDAGQIGIEHHVLSGNAEADRALIAKFLANGTWISPTLTEVINAQNPIDDPRLRYIPRSIRAMWDKNWPVKARTPEEVAAVRKERAAKALDETRQLARAGVPLLAGTDSGFRDLFPGFSLHDELAFMVQAGLTPLEALQTATINPAKFLGTLDSEGTIAQGERADLVLLEGNPLEDVNRTRKIAGVVVAGRYLSRGDLDKMLAQIEALAAR